MSAPDQDVQLRPPSSAAAAGNRLRALAACGLDRILRIESTLLRFRNPLFILFIAGTLAYGAGLAWYGLSHFDKFDIIFYNFDDAFYYFQIAWNLAQGNFSTFDGGITSTNGYHPLWMFLITPFYFIFDKDAALFGIKALELMLIAGAVVSISVAARLTRQPWFLLFATLPILYSYGDLHRGMEAAAALFMLGLFFLAICLHARNAARWRWLLASALHVEPASGGGFGSFLSTVEAPESLDAGAWFYEKMEPHFNVRAGDMGVVVDGRLAYAVARNCAPGEMLFWRWGESPRNSALRRLNKTVTGLCTDMVVLPHGAVSPMSVERGDDFVERAIRGRQPRIRSSFDVYVDTAERIIIYRKEGCVEEDVEMRFFLHVQPANPDVLTEYSKQSGFDNFDFSFGQHGQRIEGSCVAIRRLPRYPVALIRTGQLKGADFHRVWEGSFDLRDSAESGEATP